MKNKLINVSGIILRKSRSSDTDEVITVFTRELGRISFIAKGVKKIKSRLASKLELFSECRFELQTGQNLSILRGVKTMHTHDDISDINNFALLTFMAEISIMMTAEHQSQISFYDFLRDSFRQIYVFTDLDLYKNIFIMKTLHHLGHSPNLSSCHVCHQEIEAQNHKWDHDGHEISCSSCTDARSNLPINTLKYLRAIKNRNINEINNILINETDKKYASEIIENLLRSQVPRVTKSEEFMRTL